MLLTSRWIKYVGYALIYLIITGVLASVGFILFLGVSVFSRDVLRIHEYVDRGVYSGIQSLLMIGIYVGSILSAIPLTRRLMNFFITKPNQIAE